MKKNKSLIGELYGVKIFSDKSVKPGTIEIRDDENLYAEPYVYDGLKLVDVENWPGFFRIGNIKVIDKRKL